MTPERHREFAERITRSMEKVTTADYEAVIEACMLAGTHWFNVALHQMEMSATDHDVLHVEFMIVHERRKAWLVAPAMVEALERIEDMRGLHVRGNAEGGEKAAAAALLCLGVIREAALDAEPLGLTSPELGRVSLND
ncbi:MAG: hypothetical protein CL569_18185 [Alphaproteobacteria bacterium]|nr:hypothetical protein [Alphaproteobacteria bacterium]